MSEPASADVSTKVPDLPLKRKRNGLIITIPGNPPQSLPIRQHEAYFVIFPHVATKSLFGALSSPLIHPSLQQPIHLPVNEFGSLMPPFANGPFRSAALYESAMPSRRGAIAAPQSLPLDWPPSSESLNKLSRPVTPSVASSKICSVKDNLSRMKITFPPPRPPTPYAQIFSCRLLLTELSQRA